MVSRILIQNCLPIPTCKNTPKGGSSMAIMIRSRSIYGSSCQLGFSSYYGVCTRWFSALIRGGRDAVVHTQLHFKSASHPLPSEPLGAGHLVRHSTSGLLLCSPVKR